MKEKRQCLGLLSKLMKHMLLQGDTAFTTSQDGARGQNELNDGRKLEIASGNNRAN